MPSLDHPLVSIVTPAYNEEQHLEECLKSVLAQTHPHWECTIVNNCSTDKTRAIAERFAAVDSRFHVVSRNTLLPALANFNAALRQIPASSKYCKIILADDWMFPECLERMVKLMEAHPSVGIVGAYGLEGQWILWEGLPYPSDVISGREICRQRLLGGPYVFGSPSSVLFRADWVRNRDPFYNESNLQADSEVCFELLKNCDFGFVHQVLTFSRDHRPEARLEASRDLNTAAAGMLHELICFGPHYLSPEEYQACLKATLAKYYDFLSTSVFLGRDKKFWEYHRMKMKQEGVEFRYSRLAFWVAKKVLRRLRPASSAPRTPQWGL